MKKVQLSRQSNLMLLVITMIVVSSLTFFYIGRKAPEITSNHPDLKRDVVPSSEVPQVGGDGREYDLGFSVFLKHGVSYDVEGEDEDVRYKRDKIREGFIHAYGGYEEKCFGKGEVKPHSGNCHEEVYAQGLQLSLVDSLDTMLVMGLGDFYMRSRNKIKDLEFTVNAKVSVFEVNIRLLGGLLSAYSYTHDNLLLEKAIELGNKLLPVFETGTGFPQSWLNFKTGAMGTQSWSGGSAILSEIGTLQLEFVYLSQVSNNSIYAEKVMHVFDQLLHIRPSNGLYPVNLDINNLGFKRSAASPGGLGDSFYEYLLKLWLLGEKKDDNLGRWFFQEAEDMMNGFGKSYGDDMNYLVQVNPNKNVMEHLTCFAGGMFALGSLHTEDIQLSKRMLEFGKGVGKFCYEMYKQNPTGLASESVNVGTKLQPASNSRHYIMRPEAVETWFILWRVTKDPIYREWGWNFFQAIEKHTKGPYGYSGLQDATSNNAPKDDVQQSWFLAETMKYLFLLFTADDVLPLDEFVFNTEAHPLPIGVGRNYYLQNKFIV